MALHDKHKSLFLIEIFVVILLYQSVLRWPSREWERHLKKLKLSRPSKKDSAEVLLWG